MIKEAINLSTSLSVLLKLIRAFLCYEMKAVYFCTMVCATPFTNQHHLALFYQLMKPSFAVFFKLKIYLKHFSSCSVVHEDLLFRFIFWLAVQFCEGNSTLHCFEVFMFLAVSQQETKKKKTFQIYATIYDE